MSKVQNQMIRTVLKIDDTRFLNAALKDIQGRWECRMNKETQRIPGLDKAIEEIENGEYETFDNVEDAIAYLNS